MPRKERSNSERQEHTKHQRVTRKESSENDEVFENLLTFVEQIPCKRPKPSTGGSCSTLHDDGHLLRDADLHREHDVMLTTNKSTGNKGTKRGTSNMDHQVHHDSTEKTRNETKSGINANISAAPSSVSVKATKDDLPFMMSLLGNELQPYYDPTSGKEFIKDGIRNRRDHIGRPIKTGPYTKEERDILKATLETYFKDNGWDEQTGWERISSFGEGSGRSSKRLEVFQAQHWEKIAMALPQRPVRSVQLFTLRRLYPWKTGPWTLSEEKDLIQLVKRHGFAWTKFAYEYFHRLPNYIQSKWRDLEPRVSHHRELRPSERHIWTKQEDIALLKAIKTVTGVPLPYRAVPWREVQKHMPQFSPSALSWRYKNTLFSSILCKKFKGASDRVLFRQFLRYVKRSLEAGLIKDLSEVEGHRIVPFWYSSNHCRRMRRYMEAHCPKELQHTTLETQIDYMYQREKCDKKEKHDLRRLTRSYKALQELNGVMVLPAVPGVLSQRFKDPVTDTPRHLCNDSSQHQASNTLFITSFSKEQQKQLKEISRPLTARQDRIKDVVPPHLQLIPEAFPIYLEAKKRRRRDALSQTIDDVSRVTGSDSALKQNPQNDAKIMG